MNDHRETPCWKNMELKPLNLDEIPDVLRHFIYPEEHKNGVVCTLTTFTVVLLLRWALSGPEHGIEEEYEGWKVFWKTQDRYGFRTQIFLYRHEEKQWDAFEDELTTLQEAAWVELGELSASGYGVIEAVTVNNCYPYGKSLKFDGKSGVARLIEDAMLSSYHTGHSVMHWPKRERTYGRREIDMYGCYYHLNFELQSNNPSGTNVASIDVEGGEEKSPW